MTQTQGLWRTVPALYPLCYRDQIFWLTHTWIPGDIFLLYEKSVLEFSLEYEKCVNDMLRKYSIKGKCILRSASIKCQVLASQVSFMTWTQGIWRTVPALYPLSNWHPIFWLTHWIPGDLTILFNMIFKKNVIPSLRTCIVAVRTFAILIVNWMIIILINLDLETIIIH